MKKLLLILALFISISASSQTDTTYQLPPEWTKVSENEYVYNPSNTVPFSVVLLSTLLFTLYLYKTPILRKVNQDKIKWQTNL